VSVLTGRNGRVGYCDVDFMTESAQILGQVSGVSLGSASPGRIEGVDKMDLQSHVLRDYALNYLVVVYTYHN
jgi:hypothetical protein